MTDRITLEDKLLADGAATGGKHSCPNCGRLCRSFEIVRVNQAGFDPLPSLETEWACSTCITDASRAVVHQAEQEAVAALPPWETPAGVEAKACRDRMLDKYRWTVAPDSPLSEACRAEWLAYLGALHRMTVDCAGPDEWAEPPQPGYEYAT